MTFYASEDLIIERSLGAFTIGGGVGLAAAATLWFGGTMLHLPLVLAYNPFTRSDNEATRKGFRVSVDASPAMVLGSRLGGTDFFGVTAAVSVGYVIR